MQFTVKQIAEYIDGEIDGDENQIINQFNKIEEGKPNGISFLSNPKYESFLYETDSTAVVVGKDFKPKTSPKTTLIKVDNAYIAFTNLLKLYSDLKSKPDAGIHATAFVDESAKVENGVSVGPNASVGKNVTLKSGASIAANVHIGDNVTIGRNTAIHANVSIYEGIVIGDDCIVKSGAVIGGEGFGFAPKKDGSYEHIPQIGNVVLENNVSIGSNSCIDRGTMGSTRLCEGVKIDNLVQIAHNVHIGKHTVIASGTGIAGSVKIGNYCVVAGQVGFVGHIEVADYTKIGAKSGINHTVKESHTDLSGVPAFNVKDYLRSTVLFRKLPTIEKRIAAIERILQENKDK